jgi:hypothetical protein
VLVGAGSFDLAEYTRSSSFCILPISPRIWYNEPDLGRPPTEFPPTLGLGPLSEDDGSGAVVRIEGVARPLEPVLADIEMLGPRECRGGRPWYRLGRGVVAGSYAIDAFRTDMGVDGGPLTVADASDKGGDGGVASNRAVPAFELGGVEVVGDNDTVVAEVDVSETGERGRKESAESS